MKVNTVILPEKGLRGRSDDHSQHRLGNNQWKSAPTIHGYPVENETILYTPLIDFEISKVCLTR